MPTELGDDIAPSVTKSQSRNTEAESLENQCHLRATISKFVTPKHIITPTAGDGLTTPSFNT
jgi:hypothetical protein